MTLLLGIISHFDLCFSHQRMNNVMERYNRNFNNLFDLLKPGLIVFSKRVWEEAALSKKRQKAALKSHFANRQGRKEVPWSDSLPDFEDWELKKRWVRNQV